MHLARNSDGQGERRALELFIGLYTHSIQFLGKIVARSFQTPGNVSPIYDTYYGADDLWETRRFPYENNKSNRNATGKTAQVRTVKKLQV